MSHGNVLLICKDLWMEKKTINLVDDVLYFSNTAATNEGIFKLFGPLATLCHFIKQIFLTEPIWFQLTNFNVILQSLSSYTWFLIGNYEEKIMKEHLNKIFQIFNFFFGSINQFEDHCSHIQKSFKSELKQILDHILEISSKRLTYLEKKISEMPLSLSVNEEIYLSTKFVIEQTISLEPKFLKGAFYISNNLIFSSLPERLSFIFNDLIPFSSFKRHLISLNKKNKFSGLDIYQIFISTEIWEEIIQDTICDILDETFDTKINTNINNFDNKIDFNNKCNLMSKNVDKPSKTKLNNLIIDKSLINKSDKGIDTNSYQKNLNLLVQTNSESCIVFLMLSQSQDIDLTSHWNCFIQHIIKVEDLLKSLNEDKKYII